MGDFIHHSIFATEPLIGRILRAIRMQFGNGLQPQPECLEPRWKTVTSWAKSCEPPERRSPTTISRSSCRKESFASALSMVALATSDEFSRLKRCHLRLLCNVSKLLGMEPRGSTKERPTFAAAHGEFQNEVRVNFPKDDGSTSCHKESWSRSRAISSRPSHARS